jgi:solute:Na+ symporter, SSS family
MLHFLDYLVMAAYVLVVVYVCLRVTRRAPDTEELFLAGRSLGPAVIGFSLFASNISSTTLIGLPGAAWESGISVANYEWMAALVLAFTAVFVLPTLIGNRVTTLPELLERRFDARLRRYLSATSLFLSLVLDTAGSLYAGALVLLVFIPELSLGWTCAALAIFAGVYTAAGGLRAVVYTDVLQAVILLLGSLVLTGIVFGQFDYDWARVVASVPADKLSLIRPLDDPALPWLGTLIGLPILGFYYWTMNQYVAQRLLGARDLKAAGRGALFAAAMKLLPLFLMVLPGVMAAALFADLERPDTVFPRLIAAYAPPGLAGLMIAALLAAIMSSVDSALNSASTLVIADFVQPRRPALSSVELARFGRYTTLGFMLLAALWAPQIQHFPGLFAYLQQTFSYVTPPLVAIFALGMLWPGLGAKAAWQALLGGHLLSTLWFVATQLGWLNVHFTIVAGMLFAATLVFAVICQALAGQPLIAKRSLGQWRAPRETLVGAIILAAVTLLLVWVFR